MQELEDIGFQYLNWMISKVEKDAPKDISFSKLLLHLNNIPFVYSNPLDSNRESDGLNMRWKFSCETGIPIDFVRHSVSGNCSFLEMMVALAIRMESIMDNPAKGDRTSQWFWQMISNLGLGGLYNANYDENIVNNIINNFNNHTFSQDGKGSLFYMRYCDVDMRFVDIWTAMCWYLDTMD